MSPKTSRQPALAAVPRGHSTLWDVEPEFETHVEGPIPAYLNRMEKHRIQLERRAPWQSTLQLWSLTKHECRCNFPACTLLQLSWNHHNSNGHPVLRTISYQTVKSLLLCLGCPSRN